MKIKHLVLLAAALTFMTYSASLSAQDSAAAASTATTTAADGPERPNYMKIYGWAGGIVLCIVAIGVITVVVRNIADKNQQGATEVIEPDHES